LEEWSPPGLRYRSQRRPGGAPASSTRTACSKPPVIFFALIYIALGDVDHGLDWLERAYAEQSAWIGYMGVDPSLDPVRSQPRFVRLLRQARLAS